MIWDEKKYLWLYVVLGDCFLLFFEENFGIFGEAFVVQCEVDDALYVFARVAHVVVNTLDDTAVDFSAVHGELVDTVC